MDVFVVTITSLRRSVLKDFFFRKNSFINFQIECHNEELYVAHCLRGWPASKTTQLHYRVNVYDRCVLTLDQDEGKDFKDPNNLARGILVLEVDDMLEAGDEVHRQKMDLLEKRLGFGKVVDLQNTEGGGSGYAGRRLRQLPDFSFEYSMDNYVKNRLQKVNITHKFLKKDAAKINLNEDEETQLRGTIAAINWSAREGRPDGGGGHGHPDGSTWSTCLISTEDPRHRDPAAIAIIDAKSVYDSTSSSERQFQGDDDRAALEAAMIQESLAKLRARLRWMPHNLNPSDSLTKLRKAAHMAPFYTLLEKKGMVVGASGGYRLSVVVNAVRVDEEIDALNGHLADVADTSADQTDALETDLVRQLISRNASLGEQLSAEEMQRGLFDFLSNATFKPGGWKDMFPVFKAANQKYRNVLDNAWRSRKKSPSCQKQLGGLLANLTHACQWAMKKRDEMMKKRIRVKKGHIKFKELDDLPQKSCPASVEDMFLHGTDVVQALEVGHDFAKNAPRASDPEGNQSRTSKENLFLFADRIETNTMHPSTALGRMAEDNDNLENCQGPTENYMKRNMWSFFSFSFVYGMREKNQDLVIALVHKEMDGDRPLDQSILFQHEVPTVGIASWGLGFWSPHVVVIDLLGTCKRTSPALRKQLYSGLRRYRSFAKGFERIEDFVLRSRLSWTCLDCPHSHCQLDEHLAKQVKELLQAKRQQDRKGIALIKAAEAGQVSTDQDGNTALFFAVQPGFRMASYNGEDPCKATAQALLKFGAHADARNKLGDTPLTATGGNLHLRSLLVKYGADENAGSAEQL
eukprot:s448_g35.t1